MKTLLVVLLILALAIAAGQLVYSEPGLLSISYQTWVIETTPVALLILAIVSILLVVIAIKLIALLLGVRGFVNDKTASGKRKRAQKHLLAGFTEFTEGRWAQAEKHLSRIESGNTSHWKPGDWELGLISCLTAARAAHAEQRFELRDRYLERATTLAPQASTAIDITRAELQIDQKNYAQALETLAFLRSSTPKQARVIKLTTEVYRALENWSKLDALLPVVRRRKALNELELAELEQACWRGMIQSTEATRLTGYWQRLPKHAQQSVTTLSLFVERMKQENKHKVAEKMLRDQINKQWDDTLVSLYATVTTEDAAKQLDHAESWIGAHGKNATLLATLGQLCLRCELWGKARVYLESSLGIAETANTCLLLAELLNRLGEADNAKNYYAKGLRLTLDQPQLSTTPLPPNAIKEGDDSTDDSTEESVATKPADLKLVESKSAAT